MIHSTILRKMATNLGFLPGQILPLIKTAPLRYKVYSVPKRSGGRRVLAQPAREVKAMQYWILDYLKPFLPIHSAVTAYEIGTSIKENAHRHAAGFFLLKMDFSDFFPSILASDFSLHLEKYCTFDISSDEHDMISRILFWAPERSPPLRLCIGAPSSPFISNTIMYDFDLAVSEVCAGLDVIYTRYADDLAFSTSRKDVLGQIPDLIQQALKDISYPKLIINRRKTIHASKKNLRKVTGIVITPDGTLSVGRNKKRLVRSMYHRAKLGQLNSEELEKLRGLIAFISHIEPDFKGRLLKGMDDITWPKK